MEGTDRLASPGESARVTGMEAVAAGLAIAGGVLLVLLALLVVASVLGRWLFGTPVRGDFEFVRIGVAVGVFSFLPYTQLRRGHVAVDTFTARLPGPVTRALDAVWDILLGAFFALFAWRLTLGTLDARLYGETLTQFPWPVWPVYGASAALCAVGAVAAVGAARARLGMPR